MMINDETEEVNRNSVVKLKRRREDSLLDLHRFEKTFESMNSTVRKHGTNYSTVMPPT